MFRNNPFGSVVVSLLFLAALGLCWLSVRYHFGTKELYNINVRQSSLNVTLNAVDNLFRDAIQYSQRNPAITSVLHELTQPAPAPAGVPK